MCLRGRSTAGVGSAAVQGFEAAVDLRVKLADSPLQTVEAALQTVEPCVEAGPGMGGQACVLYGAAEFSRDTARPSGYAISRASA